MASTSQKKRLIRRHMRDKVSRVASHERDSAGRSVLKHVSAWSVYHRARTLALFAATAWEVPMKDVFEDARFRGKVLLLPRVQGARLAFVHVKDWQDLRPGYQGILEPPWGRCWSASQIDLMLIPGVAFAGHGHRLGQGGGFYDRLLASCERPRAVWGVCFSWAFLNTLPRDVWDQPVDGVITPERRIWA